MANSIPTLDWAVREFGFELCVFQRRNFELLESLPKPRQFTVSVKLSGKNPRTCEDLSTLFRSASRKMARILHNKGITKLLSIPKPQRSGSSVVVAPSYAISATAEQHDGFVNFKVLAA